MDGLKIQNCHLLPDKPWRWDARKLTLEQRRQLRFLLDGKPVKIFAATHDRVLMPILDDAGALKYVDGQILATVKMGMVSVDPAPVQKVSK